MIGKRKSVCINHSHRQSFFRCRTCSKPLCKECTIQTPIGPFCSDECVEQGQEFHIRAQEIEEKPEPRRYGKKILKILVVLALLFLLLLFGFKVRSIEDLKTVPSRITNFLGIGD